MKARNIVYCSHETKASGMVEQEIKELYYDFLLIFPQ